MKTCGYSNVVKRGGKYVCAVCGRKMARWWLPQVLAAGLKVPA